MRNGFFLVLPLLAPVLSGCAPLPVYYREGAPVAQVARDEAACRAAALAEAPVEIRRRYIPPVYDYRTTCLPAGCSTYRVLIAPRHYDSYDANEGRRATAARQCMADRGYARISLPACDPDQAAAAAEAGDVQPPLTESSCVIRRETGAPRIVTP